ncbi:hypothetical protein, partial [Streptomyces sp. NPDC096934]|uniref:hypothetical protein n=1 Tax=Streptomyces sp. NPDC096934 TaxID=3155551 RepID=UPI00332F31FD
MGGRGGLRGAVDDRGRPEAGRGEHRAGPDAAVRPPPRGGTLPMPLQGLLVAEAVSRIQKYEVEPL